MGRKFRRSLGKFSPSHEPLAVGEGAGTLGKLARAGVQRQSVVIFYQRHDCHTTGQTAGSRLRKALKAEVDEAAWSSLYSTVSRPFEKPKTGKIAIKVINHYGDEVLKVYGV